MQKMTKDEYKKFLLHGTRTGKLSTVRADGRPHVVPIWFDLDGDTLIFTTGGDSVKAANMKRNPHVCLCVDEEVPPFAFVRIDGTVTFSEKPEELLYWATRIGGRYMGAELAETYGKRNGVEGELLVRITPTKVIAVNDVAGF